MKNLFAAIAALLFIAWAIAFFGFHAGPLIHFLLVLMLISVAVRTAYEKGGKKSLSTRNQ